MNVFVQTVIDAASVGGLFSMMALGIGLIFGIMRLINFAHGELVMIGAYAMWLLVELPATVVVVVSAGIVVLLALAMERSAFRPLREADASTMLVASFALSYLLQNLVRMTIGSRPKPFVFAEGLTGGRDLRRASNSVAPDRVDGPHPRGAGGHRLVPETHPARGADARRGRRTSAWRGSVGYERTG